MKIRRGGTWTRYLMMPLLIVVLVFALVACGEDDGDDGGGGDGATGTTATTSAPAGDSETPESIDGTPSVPVSSPVTTEEASPAASGEMTEVSLALDWYPWSNHTGLYVAQADGEFEERGLDVEIYVPSDPSTALQLVAIGEDEFTISYEADVLLAREQGLDVVSVAALVQRPLNTIMALESSDITEPADLEGKTIGIAGVPSDEPLLATVLESGGVTLDDVEVVTVGFDLMPALLGGRVDALIGAYYVHESILAEQQGNPVTAIAIEEYGVPEYYELVLVTSGEMVREQPEVVAAFVAAVVAGYQAAEEDPQRAVDELVAAYPETSEELEREGIQRLIPYWTDEGTVPFGTQEEERWTSFADWMLENGLLSEEVDATEAFTNEFVERAQEE